MKSLRVLITDDNPRIASGLSRLLKTLGHETYLAFDGETAVRLAEEVRPQVALLDLELPDISGYQVCQRIRLQMGKDLLMAIAITGLSSESARMESLRSGFDQHWVKPAQIEDLEHALSALMQEPIIEQAG